MSLHSGGRRRLKGVDQGMYFVSIWSVGSLRHGLEGMQHVGGDLGEVQHVEGGPDNAQHVAGGPDNVQHIGGAP